MQLLRALAVAGILPILTSAHMQMHDPFPINSQEDPAVPDNLKDYAYTSPLNADGSNFPCKGYHKQETSHVSKATYKAGETATMTIKAPGAAHGGGSCQISLSYDNGDTWKVIKSMEGGCPVTLSYDFTIPKDAPSSNDVLLGWTWFNLVGNREMYMNCARVTVEGSAPGRYRRAQLANRENAALAELPDMFTCNLGKGCTTKENQNVAFPDPGNDLVKGDNSMTTTDGTGFSGGSGGAGGAGGSDSSGGSGNTGSSGGSGGSGAPASSAPAPSAPAPSAPAPPSGPASSSSAPFPNATSASPASPSQPAPPSGSNVVVPVPAAPSSAAPAAPAASASESGGSCTPGSIVCNSPTTWSMCVPGEGGKNSLTSMGSVAPGTTCTNGKIA